MPLTTRVWGAGKVLLLCGALLVTYAVFAAGAMRVALKTRDVVVPALAGKTVNEASAMLADTGLSLKVEEGRRVDSKVAAGQILLQEPAAGERTRKQRSVRVWISAGPRSTIVPSLIGESERTAQLRVTQEGFTAGPTAEIRSGDYSTGVVVAQNPPAKSKSDSVSLLVNRGERAATFVMPDLIGVNGARVADLLRTRGFRVAVVGDHPYPGVPGGIVLRQNPQAGFQIAPGEPISIEVSR
jgi:eukaryotic-like serine/threonine-protein kinase